MKHKLPKLLIYLMVIMFVCTSFVACTVTDGGGKTSSNGGTSDSSEAPAPKPYVVIFESNGGSLVQPLNCGADEIPVKPEDPTLEGNFFFGWFLDEDLTREYCFDYPLNENTTLYAYFTDAFQISTAEELIAIRDNVDAKYVLANDIVLKGATWEQIETFNGELNGNGHKICYFLMSTECATSGFIKTNNGVIKNLTIEEVAYSHAFNGGTKAGVFAGVNNGSIVNCKLINSAHAYKSKASLYDGRATSYVGLIAGQNGKTGVIESCTVSNDCVLDVYNYVHDTSGYWAETSYHYLYNGAICGLNEGVVLNCSAENDLAIETAAGTRGVTGTYYGGIAGLSNAGAKIENCWSKCEFNTFTNVSTNYRDLMLGGICSINKGEIVKCCSDIKVSVDSTLTYSNLWLAGIVNEHHGSIADCYANVDFNSLTASYTLIGGFISKNYGTIGSSYAVGTITKAATTGSFGGFVGRNDENGAINGCFSSVELHSATSDNFGPFVGAVASGGAAIKCFYSSTAKMFVGEEEYVYEGSVSGVSVVDSAEMFTSDFIFGSLYWDESIWLVDGTNQPIFR